MLASGYCFWVNLYFGTLTIIFIWSVFIWFLYAHFLQVNDNIWHLHTFEWWVEVSVSYFMEAPLAHHNYANYKMVIYSAVVKVFIMLTMSHFLCCLCFLCDFCYLCFHIFVVFTSLKTSSIGVFLKEIKELFLWIYLHIKEFSCLSIKSVN